MPRFSRKAFVATAGPIAVLLCLFVPSFSAYAQPCDCIDVGDIKRRMKEAEVAIQAYQTEIFKMGGLSYSPTERAKLQGEVQKALNKNARGLLETGVAAETNNLCQVSVTARPSSTACMRESLTRHESFHRQECLKTFSKDAVAESVVTGKDRFERDKSSMIQYATEEIAAYKFESAFLQKELDRLLGGRQIEIEGTATVPRRAGIRIRTAGTIKLVTAEDGTITGNGELREEWDAPVAPCRIVQAPPLSFNATARREGDELVIGIFMPMGTFSPMGGTVSMIHCPGAPPAPFGAAGALLGMFGHEWLRVRDEDGAERAYDYAEPTRGRLGGQMIVRMRKQCVDQPR